VESCICTSHNPSHGGRFLGIAQPFPLLQLALQHDARRFKEERDATRHELEIISKEVAIIELQWEHQRKQLLEAIDGESCNPLGFNLILN
jgi:hypothetical protein